MFRWEMFIQLLANPYNNHLIRHNSIHIHIHSSSNSNSNKMGFKEEDWEDQSRGRVLMMNRRCLEFRNSSIL